LDKKDMRTWTGWDVLRRSPSPGQTALALTSNVTVVNASGYGNNFWASTTPGDNDWSDMNWAVSLANGGSVYVKFNTATKAASDFKIDGRMRGYPAWLWEGIASAASGDSRSI